MISPELPAPARTTLTLFALVSLAGVFAGACVGGSANPAPAPCSGTLELVVTNDRPTRVRVIEQSAIDAPRTIGDMMGRGTETFTIIDRAGVYYGVYAADTGELLAAEASHPRGATSRGATVSRRCVVEKNG